MMVSPPSSDRKCVECRTRREPRLRAECESNVRFLLRTTANHQHKATKAPLLWPKGRRRNDVCGASRQSSALLGLRQNQLDLNWQGAIAGTRCGVQACRTGASSVMWGVSRSGQAASLLPVGQTETIFSVPPCCGPGGVRGLVAAAWLLLLGRQVSRDTMLAFVVEEGESWARQWLSPLGEDILVAFSPRCEADTPPQRGQSTERRNVVRANHKVFLLVVARVCRREHTNNPACGGRAVSQMREHDRAIVEEENPGRASDVFSDRQHGMPGASCRLTQPNHRE